MAPRKNRRLSRKGIRTQTVTIALPLECMLWIEKFQLSTGGNRSATIEKMIRAWKLYLYDEGMYGNRGMPLKQEEIETDEN